MAQLITFVLLVALSFFFRAESTLASEPSPLDDYDDYSDSEYNYPDFGLKRTNVKLSTIKTVLTERKYSPVLQPKQNFVTLPVKKTRSTTTPTTQPTTTTTTTTTLRPPISTSRRPFKKRYRTSTTESSSLNESHIADEQELDPVPPRTRYPMSSKTKNTETAPRTRKQPIVKSSSNRNEVKLNPNRTSSYVEFYAENNDSGDTYTSLHNIIKPNEYSFQFHHPNDYSPQPHINLFSTETKSPKYGGSEYNFFNPIVSTSTYPPPQHNFNHNRGSFKPVHTDFETDLNVSELQLETVPDHLNDYRHPPRKEPTQHLYESSEHPSHTKYASFNKHLAPVDNFNYQSTKEHISYFRPSSQYHGHHSKPTVGYEIDHIPASPVASQEQVELYNNDLREYYESIIEKQLRNSPNPADRAKYHQFLKAKHDERIEQQQSKRQPPIPSYRNRIRPANNGGGGYHNHHSKPGVRKPPPRPFTTPGLRHFRHPQLVADRTYEFPFV